MADEHETISIDELLYRLSHCDECGCSHDDELADGDCECVCHWWNA